jgi:hypothetical protein
MKEEKSWQAKGGTGKRIVVTYQVEQWTRIRVLPCQPHLSHTVTLALHNALDL